MPHRGLDSRTIASLCMPHTRQWRLSVLLLWLVLFVLCSANGAQATRLVRVGYDPTYGHIEGLPSGQAAGYGYEYLMEVSQYTDWQYEFVACKWNNCLSMLEEGALDMVSGMQRTAARERKFDFSAGRQGYEYASLVTLARQEDIYFNDPLSYTDKRVGLMRNNAINDDFEAYASSHVLRVKRQYYDSMKEVREALYRREVDMAVGSETIQDKGLKVIAHLGVRAFYVGVSKSARGLLSALDEAQEHMFARDVHLTARLHEKYFLLAAHRQGLSRQEAAFVRASPPLRVAINPTWWPLESFDGLSPQPRGIIMDVLEQLSAQMGIPFRYVRTASYTESMALMQRGEVDMITGMSGSLEKSLPGLVKVSQPLLRLPLVLIGRTGDASREVMQAVAVPSQFEGIRQLREAMLTDKVLSFETPEDAIAALHKGEISLVLMSTWRFDGVQRTPGFSHLRVVSPLPVDAAVVLGVSTHVVPQLLSIVNKSVQALDRTVLYTSIFNHTVGKNPASQWALLWRSYGIWLTPLLLLLLLVGVSLALYQKERSTRILRRVALTDELTGMGNHKAFLQRGGRLRRRGDYVLVSMDINNFKNFNAYYSHQAGNVVLQQAARVLQLFVEESELVCRNGGDEFTLLLHWPGSMDAVCARLDDLQSRIRSLDNPLSQQRLKLTFSFGLYHLPSHGTTLEAGTDCAMLARKAGKESYKTTFGIYDEAMHRKISDERLFEQEMLGAQARGEFLVRLQPKCDLHSGQVVGAEALVRWEHPQRGEIMPGAFVALFERNGFIAKLDMFVLDFVCRLLRRWTDEGRTPVPISVNMSRLHVLDYSFVDSVKAVVEMHGVDPGLIELEVTESAFLENTDVLLEIMQDLANFGIHLSMDDFGTGYSSLNMLKSIPVSMLKLDKAFLSSKDTARSRDIIRHVVSMAKDLRMEVVCEGVENAEQVDFLRTTSCRIGQGYYFLITHYHQLLFKPL